ncbi:MAG TPA: hypothetical protein DCL75_08010 [Ktedonobacter sp.]|nr:hypothetical protein [Ktedonobacter sp.]
MAKQIIKTPEAALPRHKTPPGPRGHFLLGSAPEMQHDAPGFLLELNHQYGDITRIRFAFWPTYIVNHPDDIKHILQENHKNYNNKDFYLYQMLRPLFGMGLLTKRWAVLAASAASHTAGLPSQTRCSPWHTDDRGYARNAQSLAGLRRTRRGRTATRYCSGDVSANPMYRRKDPV